MYTTIVVGTDGSPRALDAVQRAGELAQLAGCESIHVVTSARVYPEYEMRRIRAELPKEYHDLVGPDIEAVDRFDKARAVLRTMKVDIEEHETDGNPASGILEVAEAVGADLIVVGARGLGAVGRFLRGSVSTRVAHHSPCDVLIVEHESDR